MTPITQFTVSRAPRAGAALQWLDLHTYAITHAHAPCPRSPRFSLEPPGAFRTMEPFLATAAGERPLRAAPPVRPSHHRPALSSTVKTRPVLVLPSPAALAFALGLVSTTLLHAQTAPAPAPTARPAAPAAASSATQPAKDDAVQLSTFTVTEEKDIGYESMQTTSGMRTVQELKNVANSISIMNSQLMEDLAVVDIGEMSKWFVTGEESPDPAQPNQLIFRGIRNSFAVRNGWIWYSPMDAFATERVELLRGPNAFLYGEADLGGARSRSAASSRAASIAQRSWWAISRSAGSSWISTAA
jgi:hypothetical protein